MKLAIFMLSAICCTGLCSCVKNQQVEASATKISITSADDKEPPVITVKMETVSTSSRPDGKQEKIQPLPEKLPKKSTTADDKNRFL